MKNFQVLIAAIVLLTLMLLAAVGYSRNARSGPAGGKDAATAGYQLVPCGRCNGVGTIVVNPGQYPELRRECWKCGATGAVHIRPQAVKCAWCGGDGMRNVGPTGTQVEECLLCAGGGWLSRNPPAQQCWKCGGTGAVSGGPFGTGQRCPTCAGGGWLDGS